MVGALRVPGDRRGFGHPARTGEPTPRRPWLRHHRRRRGPRRPAQLGRPEPAGRRRHRHPDAAHLHRRGPPSRVELRSRYEGLGILLFSQYIETRYAADLLADDAAGIGYLLKDRVADVSDFVEALERVAIGGTALDPEVVTQLLGATRSRTRCPSSRPASERSSPSWQKDGRTQPSPTRCVISEGAVEKHVANIFAKLDLPVSEKDHRRVLAVLRFLES